MSNRLSRRGFIALLTGFVAAAGVSCSRILNGLLNGDVTADPTQTPPGLRVTSEPIPSETFDEPEPIEEHDEGVIENPEAALPPQGMADFGLRVIHVYSSDATFWDYGNNYYGSYVNQSVVNEMVDQGVIELTGSSGVSDAWRELVPGYRPGKTSIAVKVNFNNSISTCGGCLVDCDDYQLKIDAVIHPINSIIRGLKQAYPEFEYSDIWVYDATIGSKPPVSQRLLKVRFKDGCQYPGVRFFDQGCCEAASFASEQEDAVVNWRTPSGVQAPPLQKITDVLIQATYLINIPILKRHGGAGVSLGFKNHFGSIDNCPELHDWVCFNWNVANYSTRYNPLVDIYQNPHIVGKTVLTLGDGLFGDRAGNANKPAPWDSFGGEAPNSLFFSTDPVAIDCVMGDFLHYEGYHGGLWKGSDDYLKLAAESELGEHERGDPWGNGYQRIDYFSTSL